MPWSMNSSVAGHLATGEMVPASWQLWMLLQLSAPLSSACDAGFCMCPCGAVRRPNAVEIVARQYRINVCCTSVQCSVRGPFQAGMASERWLQLMPNCPVWRLSKHARLVIASSVVQQLSISAAAHANGSDGQLCMPWLHICWWFLATDTTTATRHDPDHMTDKSFMV